MYQFSFTRRTWLLTLSLAAGLFVKSQTHDFRFYPINDLPLMFQGFVGKLGSHFFLLNRANINGLGLYIYDTVSQKGSSTIYPFPGQPTTILLNEKSISFISIVPGGAGNMMYHFLELDEDGNTLHKNQQSFPTFNVPLKVTTSNNQKHVLFYQYAKKGNDSGFIQGSLIGADGEIEKQLAYSFRFDRERNIEPETFLDNSGNTHVLVYDKYNNYRISTDLTLNSISFEDEVIESETFTLQKIKLKTLRVFQNGNSNILQAEGMYTDGMDKVTSGLYRISFPQTRNGVLNPRFTPFGSEMIKSFKKGFSATEATIRNSLQLHEIIYADSGSFAIMRLSAESLLNPKITILDRGRYFRNTLPMMDIYSRELMVVSRAKNWNAPKLIFIKLEKKQGIEWQSIRKLDVFRRSDDIYNRFFLLSGEKDKISLVLYQADRNDEPEPVLISMKNGNQVIEKFPEKELIFSPMQFLAHDQYGSLYLNTKSGEGGIMIIQEKD